MCRLFYFSPINLFVFRCLTIFNVGISYQTDEQSLKEAFSKYGEVVDGKLLAFVDIDYGIVIIVCAWFFH